MFGKEKIIIIGGNAAGPAAAAKAKRVNPSADVKLFEAGEFISTGTCEIPYVLSNHIDDYKKLLFFSPERFKDEKGVDVFTNHFVNGINKRAKIISVKDRKQDVSSEYEYDKLVLATGAKSKMLPQFYNNYENVFSVKRVSDLASILDYLNKKNVKKTAIIGAGYIGLEFADALHDLGLDVEIFEKASLPMPGAEPEVSNLIKELLASKETEFHGNSDNIQFIEEENKIKGIKFDGRLREFDLIINSIGVEPEVMLARNANLELGSFGGLKTDTKQKTSDTNIFAAGDNCEVTDFITRKSVFYPIATLAHKHGHVAGANAAGGNEYSKPVIKNIAVKIHDFFFTQVGITQEEAKKHQFDVKSVDAMVPNLVKVMPESSKVFGKIVYDGYSKNILGASFFGKKEVSGYADLISAMIFNKNSAATLYDIDYNYSPPISPFVNLLSVLGKKIK